MDYRDIERVGVEGINPDFEMLAINCHYYAQRCNTINELEAELTKALIADRPTVIILTET